MAQVQIARSAETDLLNGYVFYEQQQAGIGDYFLDSLAADIDALALYAGIHPKPDGRLNRTLVSAVFDAIWNIKPRLFGPGGVANPRDSYGYRSGLRLAQTKNPSVLFVPSSVQHCTRLLRLKPPGALLAARDRAGVTRLIA